MPEQDVLRLSFRAPTFEPAQDFLWFKNLLCSEGSFRLHDMKLFAWYAFLNHSCLKHTCQSKLTRVEV